MEIDEMKKLTDQQKEFIKILKNEKEIFLMEFEQMMRKQKDELEQAIDNLHQNIIKQVDHIEDNLSFNMFSALREPVAKKGWIVQPGKRF